VSSSFHLTTYSAFFELTIAVSGLFKETWRLRWVHAIAHLVIVCLTHHAIIFYLTTRLHNSMYSLSMMEDNWLRLVDNRCKFCFSFLKTCQICCQDFILKMHTFTTLHRGHRPRIESYIAQSCFQVIWIIWSIRLSLCHHGSHHRRISGITTNMSSVLLRWVFTKQLLLAHIELSLLRW